MRRNWTKIVDTFMDSGLSIRQFVSAYNSTHPEGTISKTGFEAHLYKRKNAENTLMDTEEASISDISSVSSPVQDDVVNIIDLSIPVKKPPELESSNLASTQLQAMLQAQTLEVTFPSDIKIRISTSDPVVALARILRYVDRGAK